jgi:hypothetical protein
MTVLRAWCAVFNNRSGSKVTKFAKKSFTPRFDGLPLDDRGKRASSGTTH